MHVFIKFNGFMCRKYFNHFIYATYHYSGLWVLIVVAFSLVYVNQALS